MDANQERRSLQEENISNVLEEFFPNLDFKASPFNGDTLELTFICAEIKLCIVVREQLSESYSSEELFKLITADFLKRETCHERGIRTIILDYFDCKSYESVKEALGISLVYYVASYGNKKAITSVVERMNVDKEPKTRIELLMEQLEEAKKTCSVSPKENCKKQEKTNSYTSQRKEFHQPTFGYRICENCREYRIPRTAETWKKLCFPCYKELN